MNEFNKIIDRISELVKTAAGYIEDNPDVNEYLLESAINTEYPIDAVIDYLRENI